MNQTLKPDFIQKIFDLIISTYNLNILWDHSKRYYKLSLCFTNDVISFFLPERSQISLWSKVTRGLEPDGALSISHDSYLLNGHIHLILLLILNQNLLFSKL